MVQLVKSQWWQTHTITVLNCSKNKFSPLISSEDEKQIDHKLGLSADHIYNVLAKAHIDAAKETIPRKTKYKKDALWEKAKVISAWEQFKLAQKYFQGNWNEGYEQHLNSHLMNLYATYDQEKPKYDKPKIIEIEEVTVQKKSRLALEMVRGISRNKSSQSIKMVGKHHKINSRSGKTTSRNCLVKPKCC